MSIVKDNLSALIHKYYNCIIVFSILSLAVSWWTIKFVRNVELNIWFNILTIILLSSFALAMYEYYSKKLYLQFLYGAIFGELSGTVSLLTSPLFVSWAKQPRLNGIEEYGIFYTLQTMAAWNLVIGIWFVGGVGFIVLGLLKKKRGSLRLLQ